jgi:hypothetical protein
LEFPFELPDFPLDPPSRFSLRSDISVSVLDPDEDGDGGEQVGDLTMMSGGLVACCWLDCWCCGEAGELGEVGVACEGGVGRVDICWPKGRVVVVVRPGWAAGGGGGRQRVCLLVLRGGWRRLRFAGGGEVTSGAELWLELCSCTAVVVVVVVGASDGGDEDADEKVRVKMECESEEDGDEDGRGKELRWRLGRIFISGFREAR